MSRDYQLVVVTTFGTFKCEVSKVDPQDASKEGVIEYRDLLGLLDVLNGRRPS